MKSKGFDCWNDAMTCYLISNNSISNDKARQIESTRGEAELNNYKSLQV